MKIAKFEFSLFGINSYIVYDPSSKECVIIDPAMIDEEERKAICNFIESNSLKVSHIINTHLHIDHAIADGMISEIYGADVLAHPDDTPLGNQIKAQAAMFGLPFDVENVVIDHALHHGEKIKIGEGELEVIHVPGHSPGSIALYDEKDGFLISGDALFAGSIGRTDLPGGSHSQLIKSIRQNLLTLPPSTIVYPGHGDATTIAKEARSNPFLI